MRVDAPLKNPELLTDERSIPVAKFETVIAKPKTRKAIDA